MLSTTVNHAQSLTPTLLSPPQVPKGSAWAEAKQSALRNVLDHPLWVAAIAALIGKKNETELSHTLRVARLLVFAEEIRHGGNAVWVTLDDTTLARIEAAMERFARVLEWVGQALLPTSLVAPLPALPSLSALSACFRTQSTTLAHSCPLCGRVLQNAWFKGLGSALEEAAALEQVKAEKAMWVAALATLMAKKYGVDATRLMDLAEATHARETKKTSAPAVRATLDGEKLAELERTIEEFAKQEATQRGAALEQVGPALHPPFLPTFNP